MKETLEEAAERLYNENKLESDTPFERSAFKLGLELGSKWQSERMFTEKEVLTILDKCLDSMVKGEKSGLTEEWFSQFKKGQ